MCVVNYFKISKIQNYPIYWTNETNKHIIHCTIRPGISHVHHCASRPAQHSNPPTYPRTQWECGFLSLPVVHYVHYPLSLVTTTSLPRLLLWAAAPPLLPDLLLKR